MSDKPHHRKPAAFKLDDPRVILMDAEDDPSRPARGKVHITPETDPALLPVPIDEPAVPARRGFGWGGVFWTALAGLVVLGSGLASPISSRTCSTAAPALATSDLCSRSSPSWR